MKNQYFCPIGQEINVANLRIAAEIAVGLRPAGGPYRLTVQDGRRILTEDKYAVFVLLEEENEDGGNDKVLINTWIKATDWREVIRAVLM